MKKILWAIVVFLCVIPFFVPRSVQAQDDRWYQYNHISTAITVNTDTSFDVAETQTYLFHGTYHMGYRSIPFDKIDAVTDIRVVDETTHTPLTYSPTQLTKEDASSWGKYTTYRQNNAEVIEWYYSATDTTHTWTLYYKIVGGLSFLTNTDRLYWNIFSNYQVPVVQADVSVKLPGAFSLDTIPVNSYRTNNSENVYWAASKPDHTLLFRSSNFAVGEAFTVDAQWPKGVVDRGAYWRYFYQTHYGYIGAVAILLLFLIIGFGYWFVTQKMPEQRLTVVPEYKPPENLKPAIAEVVVKEKLTSKGFAATIVDLAVRGYVKIEEVPAGWLTTSSLFKIIFPLMYLALIGLRLASTITNWQAIASSPNIIFYAFIILFGVFYAILKTHSSAFTAPKNYKVSRVKNMSGADVEQYERDYIDALMKDEQSFTTDQLKNSTDRSLYYTIQSIKNEVYKQAEVETKAFAVDPKQENLLITILFGSLYAFFFVGAFTGLFASQMFLLVGSLAVCGVGLFAYIKFEVRLNREGMMLRDEWLGFKMFLETAEKGELQHVTPEMFPRYLPYAMIFGVEKKWANAFNGITMPPQTWYGGPGYSGGGGFSSGGGFSGFSASFSSSFSSAFSSSAGGGGGGGGGAGGGGGGGGGGAG